MSERTTIDVDYLLHLLDVVAAAQRLARHDAEFATAITKCPIEQVTQIRQQHQRTWAQDRQMLTGAVNDLAVWSKDHRDEVPA